MHDMVIRGGTIVDGSGEARFAGDIAIDDGAITQVGRVDGEGREEIDATGCIVTPGWVDIHTHYDGQATWDPIMAPSAWHGVTTVVMGNCGVGFAPAKPDRHDWLIGLMEGVEDIPGAALSEGIAWGWESFAEYLDVLEAKPRTIDIAAQVPHGAVRAYVMGERGAKNAPANAADIAAMGEIVEHGLKAGAVGFSTSRTILHRAIDGELVPGTNASRDELFGIGEAMARAGHGVFEMASDLNPVTEEFDWMRELSLRWGVPVTFALLQSPVKAAGWADQLERTRKAADEGANITGQIALRPTGVLLSWRGSVHPFITRKSWREIKDLPWEAQLEHLKDPAFRARLLADPIEPPEVDFGPIAQIILQGWPMMYELGAEPDYEPDPASAIGVRAAREGADPAAIVYDVLMQDEGMGLVYLPLLNYADGNLDHVHTLLNDPHTVVSLSDGGAHCGVICDASFPTYMLTHWARDRKRGPTIALERAVHLQTRRTARMYGFHDRGLLRPGYLADVNVIDFDGLKLERPYIAFDLPANGRRMLQRATGYKATIKRGRVTFRAGAPTGALPGQLVRGPQAAPAQAMAAE